MTNDITEFALISDLIFNVLKKLSMNIELYNIDIESCHCISYLLLIIISNELHNNNNNNNDNNNIYRI